MSACRWVLCRLPTLGSTCLWSVISHRLLVGIPMLSFIVSRIQVFPVGWFPVVDHSVDHSNFDISCIFGDRITFGITNGKKQRSGTWYSVSYTSYTRESEQKRFTILEVAADRHELMILQSTTRPSIAGINEHWTIGPEVCTAASRHTTFPMERGKKRGREERKGDYHPHKPFRLHTV